MNLGRVNRREFVTHAAASGMALPMLGWMNSAQAALQGKGKAARTRSLILLWMGGGPSTIDLWDLKPGSKNGGEFKPISTTGGGQISEHLPRMARQMKHLNIVRSYNSRDGAHERGTYINHTAYAPVPTVVHPSIGGVVASRNSPETLDIPGHICLGGAGLSPGFLGTQYAPFRVEAGPNPIPNLKSPVEADRFNRRVTALRETQEMFARQNRGDNPKDHKVIYDKTFKLMGSNTLNAFKIDQEPEQVRKKYGESGFGKNCLLARRLVEIGVPFIEVGFGGWDMHQGIFNALAGTGRGMAGNAGGAAATPKLQELDAGFAALVEDLVQRGLWATTTVVWMGDFGRTPRINQDGGRDHWPSPWSVVLGGGGMKGGEVVGSTDDDGMTVKDRPVEVSNLFATLYKATGIEPNTELRSPNGRPIKLTGTFGDGDVIKELF
jgi:hypothetical protein